MQEYNENKAKKRDEYLAFIKDEDGDKYKEFYVVDFPILIKKLPRKL